MPDHWELLDRDEVVVSTALTEWFHRVQEYMPRVEYFELLPEPITLSERFAISGAGFHEGERVELSIEFSDGSEAPLDHGSFRWEGRILDTAPAGPAKGTELVLKGTEVVSSSTRSAAIVALARGSATTPPLTPVETEYSMADLAAWYETLKEVVWRVPGISWTDLAERTNRIEIGMFPQRGGREKMEAALATVDVPRGAIVVDVGCEGIRQWPLDLGEPPDDSFIRAFDYSLEAVSKVAYGETVGMKLVLQNVSDESVSLLLGGKPPYDFVVSTPDGEQVWHWNCAKIVLQPLDSETLEPGEELEFVGEWEQVDNRGEPVPPGTYLVQGVLNLEWPEKLVTDAHELEVLE